MSRCRPPPGLTVYETALTESEREAVLKFITVNPLGWSRWAAADGRKAQYFGEMVGSREVNARMPQPVPKYPMPEAIRNVARLLKDRGYMSFEPNQGAIYWYAKGESLLPHHDLTSFGPEIIMLSLLGECRTRFSIGNNVCDVVCRPGTLLRLEGNARYLWTHAIPPVRDVRVSLVFRSVNNDDLPIATIDEIQRFEDCAPSPPSVRSEPPSTCIVVFWCVFIVITAIVLYTF